MVASLGEGCMELIYCRGFCVGVVVLEMEKEIELYGRVLKFLVDKM